MYVYIVIFTYTHNGMGACRATTELTKQALSSSTAQWQANDLTLGSMHIICRYDAHPMQVHEPLSALQVSRVKVEGHAVGLSTKKPLPRMFPT